MQSVSVSIEDQLKNFADSQVASGRYASMSDYVRHLIDEDERRALQEKLEAALIEGIESGAPSEMTRQDWADIRRDAMRELEARRPTP